VDAARRRELSTIPQMKNREQEFRLKGLGESGSKTGERKIDWGQAVKFAQSTEGERKKG